MLAAILFSCATEEKGQLEQINVSIKNSSDYNLSEIAEKVTPLVLETKEECLISNIFNLISTKDFYFVLNSFNNIYQFDKKGMFVQQIGNTGRGPGEYQQLGAMAVNEENEIVYTYSNNKLMKYNFDGDFVGEIDYKKGMIHYMAYVNRQLYAMSQKYGIETESGIENRTTLYILDNDLNFNDSIPVSKTVFANISSMSATIPPSREHYISDLKEHTYFHYPEYKFEPFVRDTLYELNDNRQKPYLRLNIKEAVQDNTRESSIRITKFYCTEDFLFANYSYQKQKNLLCINLKTGEQMNVESGFNDDFYDIGKIDLFPLLLSENQLCFFKDGYELEGKIENVDENSNPVVFIVKLK